MSRSTLGNAGLRTTIPRRLILDFMENSDQRHLAAEDIYRALGDAGHEVGIATVYRVLTQFEQSGLVLKHRFDGEKSTYELNDERHHDHMVCIECGRVYEFVDPQIEKRQEQVAGTLGFTLQDHSLHLFGVCEGMEKDGKCSLPQDASSGIHQMGKQTKLSRTRT